MPGHSESSTTPEGSSDKKHRVAAALVPFVIAVVCAVGVGFVTLLGERARLVSAVGVGILGPILFFDMPVCLWVIVEWIRDGEPPEMSLSPLIPSRAEREFRRQLRERPKLNDDEFYRTFFAQRSIPQELPVRLRKTLEDVLGMEFGALRPEDNLVHADAEMDWADVFEAIERRFEIRIPEELQAGVDGTFNSLLDCVIKAQRTAGRGS